MTVYSHSRLDGYRTAVQSAQNLTTMWGFRLDDVLDTAMCAMNSVRKYVRSGFLRRQVQENGVETIVVVTPKQVVTLPAVEDLLLWVTIDSALRFLSSVTGVAVVANQVSDDNLF